MFSLTLREQFLVAGVLCALVTGAAIKHWRDDRRAAVPVAVAPVGAGDARGLTVR